MRALAAGDPELDAGRGQGVARGTVLTGPVVSQVTLALQPIHVEAVGARRAATLPWRTVLWCSPATTS